MENEAISVGMGARVWTILFKNNRFGAEDNDPFVWVCASRESYDRNLAHLRSLKHIEVLKCSGIFKA